MVRREGGAEAGRRRRALRWGIGAALAGVLVAAAVEEGAANIAGPILPFTSAPGDPITNGATCNFAGSGCHEKFEPDSGPGTFLIEAPASYTPGETYLIRIDLAQDGQLRWGFQMTAIDDFLEGAGAFAPTDANTQTQPLLDALSARRYIAHTEVGTAAGQPDANFWTVEWTAPSTDVGPVTFYASGNAADNSGTAALSDDYIYITNVTIAAPEPGSVAAGLLGLSTAAALARSKDRPRSKDQPRRIA
jgi:hypothetical protein